MHVPINVKSPNNISEWQMEFNSAFKGLMLFVLFHNYYILLILICMDVSLKNVCTVSFTYTAYHFRIEKQTNPLR